MTADADTLRLARTPGMTAAHIDLWQQLRDLQTVDPKHPPMPLGELAGLVGARVADARRMVAWLERHGWVHRERRTTATGGAAPSRILATVPPVRDRTRELDRLMREVPCGA